MKVAIAFALSLATATSALGCEPKEYAQYKDQAKTPFGRTMVALDYCAAREAQKRGDFSPKCRDVASRSMDAIMAAKDTKRAKWANDGCPDPSPK